MLVVTVRVQGADIRRFYRVGMVLSKPWAWIQGNLLHC